MATAPAVATQDGPWSGSSGSDSPIDRILRRFNQAKNRRDRWNDIWDDCFAYGLPGSDRMRSSTDGEAKTTEIYDSTAVSAVADFASRLQSYVCPIGARWSTLQAGPGVPAADRPEINRQLRAVEDYLFGVLDGSNFDQQVPECFAHLAVGSACLAIEPGDAIRPVVFTAIPLNELILENTANGQPTGIYRERTLLNRDLPFFFPEAQFSAKVADRLARDDDGTTRVVEACIRMAERGEERWHHMVVFETDREIVDQQMYVGAGSCPYIPFHWQKSAGDSYGRGPLANVIGAVKVLNTIVEMMLEHAEVQIAGMWQADDDGVINVDTIQLIGGTIIPKAPGSEGLQPLTPGGKIEWAQWGIQEMRGEIRRALFDEPLGNMQQDARIQTAQEVVERTADLSRRVGSSFGRLQAEMVQPVVRRVLYILRAMGRIKMPTLSNRVVEIRMTSPIARTQKTAEIVSMQRYNQVLVETFGPGSGSMFLKQAEFSEGLAERLGVPLDLINSPAELAAIQQQRQQQAMIMEMIKGAGMPDQSQQNML